ncbi:DUF6777 domain-containing protein [Kitasatospora sp. NPDC058190]|uniref:DUF6777 domain-containing protein n=1 Tax=Kitasatospora sp. NPDC058190 TaxID=3346371 RepID=UPI0036DAB9F2
MAATTVAAAVVATVLIVNNQGGGGKTETLPTANEVALQAPADPGPDPFTPSVETTPVTPPAPAPATSQAQQPGQAGHSTSPAALHSVQGASNGLYAGTMSKPSCDTERLIGMVSTGDTGRAWASAAGIDQSAIPSYLRSLTSAYLRVDTRVTNHNYKSGAVTEYQSALQAGTAVLVDAQGVPRVRCSCGNPLKPPVLVSDAKYVGHPWQGFQPTNLIVVVPAPQAVTEIVLVNVETGGWFARLTGRIEVVDKHVEAPKGPLAPGVPPPGTMKPGTPTATSSTSGATSGPGSATTSKGSPSGATSSGATSSGAKSSGATSSGATSSGATSSGATSSGAKSSGATSSGATSSGATSSGASTGTGTGSASASTSSAKPSETTATTNTSAPSTAATTAPSALTQSPQSPSNRTTTTGSGTTSAGTSTSSGTTSTATAPKPPTTTGATP